LPAPSSREALARIERWAQERGLVFRHDRKTGFGAVFSPCETWRYLLWRMGQPCGKLLGMGMLNPSRADAARDDPTIRQCRARARQSRLSGVLVWNLFAFRATLPADLKLASDPVGPANDAAVSLGLSLCARTILAWGNHGAHRGRDEAVLALCRASATRVAVLGLTAQGRPRHPLYLPAAAKARPWPMDIACGSHDESTPAGTFGVSS
jgi:hypothetical protein